MSRSKFAALAVSLALGAGLLPSAAASAWAPADQATVHPGVQVFTEGAQCTANFVFEGSGGVYLGQAAHCSGTGGATETDGCESGSLPIGTPVEVTGASRPGTLAYNSWLAMQASGESDPDACAFNDFALIRLDPADVCRVNPSVPGFGGPTGVGTVGGLGSTVYSYGNSELRGGLTQLSPKQGVLVRNEGGGWNHDVVTATPGIPGDSGSGFLNDSGVAIGVLSTLQLAPLAGSNGVGDLARELAYMRSHSPFADVQLVPGTEPFRADLRGAILSPGPPAQPPACEGQAAEGSSAAPSSASAATPRASGRGKARHRCHRGRKGKAPRRSCGRRRHRAGGPPSSRGVGPSPAR